MKRRSWVWKQVISIDSTGVSYQPDPGDPGTQQTLAEVWDFSNLSTTDLTFRTFNTVRDDTTWSGNCLEVCSTKDTNPLPNDGNWQAYLKIDIFDDV